VPIDGNVLSMIKVAHVKLPALSVTINLCIHSSVIVCPEVTPAPSSVAPERFISSKYIVTFPETFAPEIFAHKIIVHEITLVNVGCVLSIVKVAQVELPALSVTINICVNSPVISVHHE